MRRLLALWIVLVGATPGIAGQESPGLIVEEIAAESSAIKAGLRAGDVLVDYEGNVLHSPAALQALEDNTFGKAAIVLRVRHGTETLTMSVPRGTLGVQTRPALAPPVLALYEEGRNAHNAGKYEDAVAPWTAAVNTLVESGRRNAAAWMHSRLGQLRETQRMWKEATAAYSAALQLVADSADAAARSRVLAGLARCAQGANDIESALRWLEQAVRTNTTANFENWASDRLTDLGALHYNREPAVTQGYFERALTIRERLDPDSIDVSNSLYNLGTVEWRRGDLASAEDHLSRSIALKERLGASPADLAGSLTNLANVFFARGDLAAAHDHNSRALAIEERLAPKSLKVANSLNNLANVATDRGDSTDPRLQTTGASAPARHTRAYASEDEESALRSAGVISERGAISRLPFTRDEADAIVSLAPPGESLKATDFKASRAIATGGELGNYRIVHLASHGVLNTDHPELSGIVLSLVDEQGKSQEGFLRLHEVYNLNWSAELVVLSACQTALGREVKGEGLVGLTRGFMYGGAKNVVASLWNVNDAATAAFMRRFYQGLLSQRLPPAAALRAAQVEMSKRKSWSSPYYWAGFVIQGDWK